jgi:hypothetical protein
MKNRLLKTDTLGCAETALHTLIHSAGKVRLNDKFLSALEKALIDVKIQNAYQHGIIVSNYMVKKYGFRKAIDESAKRQIK